MDSNTVSSLQTSPAVNGETEQGRAKQTKKPYTHTQREFRKEQDTKHNLNLHIMFKRDGLTKCLKVIAISAHSTLKGYTETHPQ